MTDELLATSKSGPGQTAVLIADCTNTRISRGARVTSTADATPAHAIAISDHAIRSLSKLFGAWR